jgi:hypothetical protein
MTYFLVDAIHQTTGPLVDEHFGIIIEPLIGAATATDAEAAASAKAARVITTLRNAFSFFRTSPLAFLGGPSAKRRAPGR